MERAQLSAARHQQHWTLEEAAEHLGVDKATLQRWEKGKSIPQALNLRKLCEVYGKTAWELGIEQEMELASVAEDGVEPGETRESVLSSFRRSDLTLCMMRMVWNWPCRDARYHELQMMITMQLEDNSMNPVDSFTRRDALRRLALLPIEMCGLSALSTALKRPQEEILAQCAAGMTACWYLRKGKELAFASQIVSAYLPTLKTIVTQATSQQRKAAADLLAQGFLLKATLAWSVTTTNDAIGYAQQAERYAEMADETILRILALRTQAAAYHYALQCRQALHMAEKARHLLETTTIPMPPLAQSYVYAGLATYRAYNGQQEGALSALRKAHTAFIAQTPDDVPPIWIDHNHANLTLNDGLTHYHLGFQKAAIDAFAQVDTIPTRTESIRVESLINQIMAEVNRDDQTRDMEWCIDYWMQGIEGAKTLQSNQRFQEAVQAYTAMHAAWPGERRIKDLRDHIVHW